MNQVSTELVTELDLGSARGGKAGSREPLTIIPIRGLTKSDLSAITNPPPVGSTTPLIQTVRHSHHQLAQLLSEGKEAAEISRVTGYSTSRIASLQTDPAFNELISYYSHQRELVFVDAQERMRVLGLDAAEKLHEKLHDQTEEWTKRELMEVIELALGPSLAPKPPAGAPGGASGGLCLEVKFVAPEPTAAPKAASFTAGGFTDLTPLEPS